MKKNYKGLDELVKEMAEKFGTHGFIQRLADMTGKIVEFESDESVNFTLTDRIHIFFSDEKRPETETLHEWDNIGKYHFDEELRAMQNDFYDVFIEEDTTFKATEPLPTAPGCYDGIFYGIFVELQVSEYNGKTNYAIRACQDIFI